MSIDSHSTHPDVLLIVAQMAATLFASAKPAISYVTAVQQAINLYEEANKQLKTRQVI